MIGFFEFNRREWKEYRIPLYRASIRLFVAYVLLSGLQVFDLFYGSSFLRLDLVLFSALVLAVPLLAFDIEAGNLPPVVETSIQYVFLCSLLALAVGFSSPSLFSGPDGFFWSVKRFFERNSTTLLTCAVSTGALTLVSVRANEIVVTFPLDGRVHMFGRTISYATLAVGLGLAAIICYYVSIRWPFMASTFGGVPHSDKYATHVPILQEMYRTADPFHFQNRGYTSMFDRGSSVYEKYYKVPIFSWGALPLMIFERQFGTEFVVRSFLTMQGVVLLLVLFSLLRVLFDNVIALVGTALLAVNPLFNLVSYLTVMDLPALVLGFASIVLYWRGRKTYSYLLCGLAALTKYSFLLITVPVLAILILTNETEKFYNAVKLGFFTFVPILLYRTLVAPIPGDSLAIGSLRLSSFVGLLGVSVLLFERHEGRFVDAVSRINRRVRYSLMVGVPALGFVLLWDLIVGYAPNFLTDRYLLFNAGVYVAMLDMVNEQLPDVIFYLFPLGVLWILRTSDEKLRTTIVALVLGAALYAIVAAKSVFIHAYYKHVLVFVCIIGFLGLFDAIRRAELPRTIVVPILSILIILLVASSQAASVALLNEDVQGTEEMGEYIDENVEDSELVLYSQPQGRLLAIYSDARFTHPSLSQAPLEAEVQKRGLGSALRDRNVRYYLSNGESTFEEFEPLLRNGVTTHQRRNLILDRVGSEDSSERASNNGSISAAHFELEARYGEWYLYRIRTEEE